LTRWRANWDWEGDVTRRGRRLGLIAAALAVLAAAAFMMLFALRDSIVFFKSPSELGEVKAGIRLRIGGLVKEGSVNRPEPQVATFTITDRANDVKVSYHGALPDLFREGQGVVAEGVLEAPGFLRADTVLAKHDERYMPREVVDALKKQGVWQGGEAVPTAVSPPK
jgi:cytochrome c-type biogenesis protein CcmE